MQFQKDFDLYCGRVAYSFKRLNNRTVQLLICKIMRYYFRSKLKVQKTRLLLLIGTYVVSLVTLFDKIAKSIDQNQELFDNIKNSVLCWFKLTWIKFFGKNFFWSKYEDLWWYILISSIFYGLTNGAKNLFEFLKC